MDESPRTEMTGNEQPTAGMEPVEGYDPGAPQTQEGGASGLGEQPTAGTEPAEGRPDLGVPGADTGGSGGTSDWQAGGWRVRDENPRDWVTQLQGMIDGIAEHAGPVLREVAAKAAELAAVAAENAGPALHRAADVTADVGQKVAVRSKEYAAELRRQQAERAGEQAASEAPGHGGGEPLA